RREPVTASLVGAVALMLALATGASWGLTSWALGEKARADNEVVLKKQEADEKNKEAVAARKAEKEAKDQRARADAQADELRNQLHRKDLAHYAGQLGEAQWAWLHNDGGRAIQILRDCQRDLRNWEHGYL